MWLLAHGAAGRSPIPIELWQAAWLAAVTVPIVAVALPRRIRIDRLPERRLPRPLRAVLGVVGVLGLVSVVVSGDGGFANNASVIVLMLVWGALPLVAAAVGDPWPALVPWGDRARPGATTSIALWALAWLVAVADDPEDPERLAVLTVVYAVTVGLLRAPDPLGAVTKAAATFDPELARTVAPVLLAAAVSDTTIELVAWTFGAHLLARVVDPRALLPVALGWHLTQHVDVLLTQGQLALNVVSDPFGRGWDLFGTATRLPDHGAVPEDGITLVQSAALVAGPLVGLLVGARTWRTTTVLTALAGTGAWLLVGT
ncbi:MAG TPA: hypothetical protein VEA78_05560 [Acidimicrobiales bacterium]|nr:hypothetical protein [Acidimicrobiales bacterium]